MIIEVNNLYGKILDHLTIDQLAVIQQECQFKMEGSDFKAMSFRNRGIKWDGYKKLFNIQTKKFNIGLLARITKLLNRYGISVDIIDNRIHLPQTYNYEYDQSMLRNYQMQAVITSVMHGNGILKVATGGGKTVIAGYTIGALGKKSIFIVHTRDLLYQAKESFARIFPNETIGQIGDGVIDYQNITVATMQTLAILGGVEVGKNKYDEDATNDEKKIEADKIKKQEFNKYRKTVQCVMMDEVQIVCSQTAQGVRFLFESADYAFGYSASPWRDDGSDLEIEGAFGERIIDISASELIRRGYLIKPTIEVHKTYYPCTDISGNYVDIYKRYITDNAIRNEQIALDAIKQYQSGMNTLILVTQINHGNAIADIIRNRYGVDVSFISGKSGMKKRKEAIQNMRDGKISLLIASTIADVGLDIPRLQCIVEAGAGKSSVTALQRLGRIMRLFEDKKDCLFITYRDSAPFICQHIDKKLAIWRIEEEFVINEL
jgi:superfamily II DNA or RNA helicase